jgi:uncharacterized protein (TIGR02271 family)
MATNNSTGLARLDEMDDFKVADGDLDPRGWDVVASDNRRIGEIKHLIADPAARRVRYLEIELDREVREGSDKERRVLVPIGEAQLHDDDDQVVLRSLAYADAGSLPTYTHGTPITRDYESTLRSRFGAGGATAVAGAAVAASKATPTETDDDFYAHEAFDEDRFRRPPREADGTQRMTLSEEQLKVGTRQRQAGMVELRKTVETQHVSEKVPLTHEEVTVERRPLAADAVDPDGISESEVRMTLMAEEAVVEKRVVPVEEVVVSKRAVAEERTVEADLRKERVEYDEDDLARSADRAATGASRSAKQTAQHLGDRIADKVDDVKDRVDGNPASKPGRDSTDRGMR